MNKYIVCNEFKDVEDNHIYAEGNAYPHKDRDINSISIERIESLLSTNNKTGKQLIRVKKVEECSIEELKELHAISGLTDEEAQEVVDLLAIFDNLKNTNEDVNPDENIGKNSSNEDLEEKPESNSTNVEPNDEQQQLNQVSEKSSKKNKKNE